MNKRAEAGGPSNRVLILTGAWLCFPPLWRVFRHGSHFRCRRVSFSDFDSQQSDQKAHPSFQSETQKFCRAYVLADSRRQTDRHMIRQTGQKLPFNFNSQNHLADLIVSKP